MISGHGGNIHEVAKTLGCSPTDIMDMSSNVNPAGPLPGLLAHLQAHLEAAVSALPQADAAFSIAAFAARYGLDPQRVLAANGTTQFIYTIPRALNTQKALILAPTYADYADACAMHQVECNFFFTHAADGFRTDMAAFAKAVDKADTVFICNPNNPTGVLIPQEALTDLCRDFAHTHFIIDESYMPFVDPSRNYTMMSRGLDNVLVLNSMSKIFRVPGLRIGFLIAASALIKGFSEFLMPWSVNSLAQQAITYLMEQAGEVNRFVEGSRQLLEREKKFIAQHLSGKSGIRLFPSTTSFILGQLSPPLDAAQVCGHLRKKRILLRNCANFQGLTNQFFRISIKTREVNALLVKYLDELIGSISKNR